MRSMRFSNLNAEFHEHLIYNLLNNDNTFIFNSVKHGYESDYGVVKDFDNYNTYYVQPNTNSLPLEYNHDLQTCSYGQTKFGMSNKEPCKSK